MVPITNISGRLGNQMFQLAYIYAEMRKKHIPDIYVQSYKYFDEFGDEIRKWYGEGIEYLPYVAIHVRRANNPLLPSEPNYSENTFYVNLFDDGYYERAMEEFPDSKFMLFSDDIEWCKKQTVFEHCAFSEGYTDVGDMNRMASCLGHIIANSSFSFWGAYLSPWNGKVIAPKNWFSDGIDRVELPPYWIRI